MTLALRPATPTDAPAFHAVMMAAGMDARSSWVRTTVEDIAWSLPLGGGFLAWANLNGAGERAVGCVSFRPDGAQTLTLNKLATLPDMRGQGIGAALVRAVEKVAAERGYERVLLAVSQYNLEVVPFYERLGYVVDETVEYAFASPGSLRPVALVKTMTNDHTLTLKNRLSVIVNKLEILRRLDSRCKVFGADSHRYVLNPCLGFSELQEAQDHLGNELPDDYSGFLCHVGNGGAGPDYGIFSLGKSLRTSSLHSFDRPFPYVGAWQPLFGGFEYGELDRQGKLNDYMSTPFLIQSRRLMMPGIMIITPPNILMAVCLSVSKAVVTKLC